VGGSAMDRSANIYVAGHKGLTGSAITNHLQGAGYDRLLLRTHSELDLTNQFAVDRFFDEERPDYVFLCAAKVGGILANSTLPADFIRENLLIQTNVIDAAYRNGASKLLFLGSSCIYPRAAPQPMKEEYLLTGPLEPTNEAYAVAKLAGISLCQSYRRQFGFPSISLMPTNLYGPQDNFDLESSHVLAALIRKFHDAVVSGTKEVAIWGSGAPLREFLFIDDLAEAAVFLMDQYDDETIINVGTGEDLSVQELALIIKEISGFSGELRNDLTKPDGMPRKLMDVTKINNLGWRAKTNLKFGIEQTYRWYAEQQSSVGVITG
jgi:GDP-L-fucose synthase